MRAYANITDSNEKQYDNRLSCGKDKTEFKKIS